MSEHPKRRCKVVSLSEAASLVTDNARIALGGFGIYNRPLAFVRELVRQGKQELTVVGTTNGPEIEYLVGGGAISRLESSYIGLEKWGLAPRSRQAIQTGELEMVDFGEVMSFDRFRASEDGWDFLPVDYLGGNSLLDVHDDIVPFNSPLTGRPMHAVPPAAVDVAIIHVPAADQFGNAMLPAEKLMPQGLDEVLSRSTDRVILTTERIVDSEYLERQPHLVQIPSFRVEAVSFAPWGAHPAPMFGNYDADGAHMEEMIAAGADVMSFDAYLNTYIRSLPDHAAYLELIGPRRILGLKARSAHE